MTHLVALSLPKVFREEQDFLTIIPCCPIVFVLDQQVAISRLQEQVDGLVVLSLDSAMQGSDTTSITILVQIECFSKASPFVLEAR